MEHNLYDVFNAMGGTGVEPDMTGSQLIGAGSFDPLMYRPYIDSHGRRSCAIRTGRMIYNNVTGEYRPEVKAYTIKALQERNLYNPTWNAQLLPLRSWIAFDDAVVKARRQRLRAYSDLAAFARRANFDAWSKMTIEYQVMTDPLEVVKDMDGTSPGRHDRALLKTRSAPLPVMHCDFFFTDRALAVSRGSRVALDSTNFEAASRRIFEMAEQGLIGTVTGVTYGTRSTGLDAHEGTSTEYGYTTFPYRVTKTDLHTPVTTAPQEVVEDILEMRETMRTNGYFGPYMVYHSTGYDRFNDDDYFRTGGTAVTRTLRERVESIEGIAGFRRLDFLTSGYQLIMVNMDRESAEAIIGMEPTTMMWTGRGGMIHYYMIMAIMTQIMKAPYNGVAGIIHATTS